MNTLLKAITAISIILLLGGPALAESLEERLQQRGLDVACSYGAQPLCFKDLDGEPQGVIIDVWKAWSNKTGIPVRLVLSSWQEAMQSTLDGRTDVLASLIKDAERRERFDFSKPMFKIETVLIAKAESGNDEDFFAREGVVGVIKATFGEKLHGIFRPGGKMKAYIDADSLLKAFSEGEVDGMITYLPSFIMLNSQLERPIRHEIVAVLDQSEICMAVRKGNEQLIEVINKGLSRISDRERKIILNRWFVRDQTGESSGWTRYRLLGILLLAVMGFIVFRITRHPKQ